MCLQAQVIGKIQVKDLHMISLILKTSNDIAKNDNKKNKKR